MFKALIIARRVARQLVRNRRLVGPLLVLPLIEIYVIHVVVNALASSPGYLAETFVVPFVAFLVSFITFLLCLLALVKERSQGTLARSFVAGYRRDQVVLGYVIAYGALVAILAVESLGLVVWIFGLELSAPQLGGILVTLWLLGMASLALGILLSNFAETEGQAVPFIPGVLVFSLFLSGLVVPVDNLAGWAQVLAFFLPLRYAVTAIKAMVLAGASLGDEAGQLLALAAWAVLFLWIAGRTLPGDAAQAAPAPTRRRTVLGLIILVPAILGGGIWWQVYSQGYLYVDDAQVQGHVIGVVAPVPGRLQSWRAQSGQTVRRGETLGTEIVTGEGEPSASQPVGTVIAAPLTGVVLSSVAVPGMAADPSGGPLAVLVDPRHLWVEAYVPETEIRRIRLGALAEIRVDAHPDLRFLGQVTAVAPAVQGRVDLQQPEQRPTNPAGNFVKSVQRVPVRLRLFDPAWKYLMTGESAEVTFWLEPRGPLVSVRSHYRTVTREVPG